MAEKSRVLIVDDDVSFSESLADILDERGHEAIAVNGGEEALEKVKEMPFDVILMDIKMPIMDGVDTYKRIKKISPQTPVIMMTAYSVEDLIEKALGKGAYSCIYKPFDPKEAIDIIEEIKKKKKRVEMVKKILIVDDETNARTTLADIFAEYGYEVVEAASGEEALEKARKTRPDVVLLDTLLPGIGGNEVCRQIKKIKGAAIKVILYTGIVNPIDAGSARDAGADDYVMKTSDLSFLIEAVKKLV